ncbi:MAG: HlyD family efflux transporter periplasmic adaptor subunit [Phycisphaerales bacterium]|nr:HlyD family efflux transporter periplasmic adaptor subunit [Phycisphaerales bacterium]
MRTTLLIIIGIAVVALIVYAMRPQPIPVDAAVVVRAPMQVSVDEEGKTRIRDRYVVSSPLTGRLRRITLDPGDAVIAEETVLAVIEPTDPELLDARALAEAEARVRAAEAAVRQSDASKESARIAYDFAENELTKITNAFESGGANPRELDDAQTKDRAAAEAYRAAQFGKEIAIFELEVARSALLYAQGETEIDDRARMALQSPIDGVVLRVMQESVAVVMPGTPLIEVGDPRDLEVVIDVLSTDGVNIAPGQRVRFEHWGKPEPLEGVVRLVEPSAFTRISALGIEEQRVNVIADFATPASERETLGDGFRVEANIIIWEHDAVLQIPTSAAFRTGEHWSVFLIDDDNDDRVSIRTIETGRRNGRTTEVLAGLEEGDRVVLHPSDQLSEGARVEER